jgi:flagellar hook-length control protein FliK
MLLDTGNATPEPAPASRRERIDARAERSEPRTERPESRAERGDESGRPVDQRPHAATETNDVAESKPNAVDAAAPTDHKTAVELKIIPNAEEVEASETPHDGADVSMILTAFDTATDATQPTSEPANTTADPAQPAVAAATSVPAQIPQLQETAPEAMVPASIQTVPDASKPDPTGDTKADPKVDAETPSKPETKAAPTFGPETNPNIDPKIDPKSGPRLDGKADTTHEHEIKTPAKLAEAEADPAPAELKTARAVPTPAAGRNAAADADHVNHANHANHADPADPANKPATAVPERAAPTTARPARPDGEPAAERPSPKPAELNRPAVDAAASLKSGAEMPSHLNLLAPANHGSAAAGPAGAPSAGTAPVAVPIAGLVVEIAAQAQAGKSRFAIRLDPPELGRIDVRLDVDREGNVATRLVVERPETLDLLRRDAPQLERALQQAGLKTGDHALEFSLRDQAFGRDAETPRNPAQLIVPEEDGAPLEALKSNYGRLVGLGGGIDIRV